MSLKVSIIILSCRSEEIYKYRIKNKNIRRQSDRVSLFRNIAQEANGQKYVVDFHLPSDDDTRICIAGYAYPAIWAWQCARRLTTMIIRHNGPLIDSQASQKGLAGFLKKACESKRSYARRREIANYNIDSFLHIAGDGKSISFCTVISSGVFKINVKF